MAHEHGLTGATIRLIDFRKSLAQRKVDRAFSPGYKWLVNEPITRQQGRGFYFSSNSDAWPEMDGPGSSLRLRLDACESGRNAGWSYGDGAGVIRSYVARLPHARGFIAAWGEGAGMWGVVDGCIYKTFEEAAYVAGTEAQHAAMQMDEDQAVLESEEEE